MEGEDMALDLNHSFDENNYRHYLNGTHIVLHCHHYMSLTVKLAEAHEDIGGTKIIAEAAEDSVRPLFDAYTKEHTLGMGESRLKMAMEFYSVMGMGNMQATGTATSGNVVLTHSHVDVGWQKKWGNHTKPVNHFTRGYIAAMFGAAFDKPARSYKVTETESIVMGNPSSIFVVESA
jgi:predicted hydrocarbon binding protein